MVLPGTANSCCFLFEFSLAALVSRTTLRTCSVVMVKCTDNNIHVDLWIFLLDVERHRTCAGPRGKNFQNVWE